MESALAILVNMVSDGHFFSSSIIAIYVGAVFTFCASFACVKRSFFLCSLIEFANSRRRLVIRLNPISYKFMFIHLIGLYNYLLDEYSI